jgi:hypothetical protein
LHVTGAFAMSASVGLFMAIALALRSETYAPIALRLAPAAGALWAVGGFAAIGFGIWLAIHVSQYSLTDGWILAAIVLWVVGAAIGGRISAAFRRGPAQPLLAMNVVLALVVLAILIDMIYKPGAG